MAGDSRRANRRLVLTGWVEDNIEETLTQFRLPLEHCNNM
jgi:hypothetical protein